MKFFTSRHRHSIIRESVVGIAELSKPLQKWEEGDMNTTWNPMQRISLNIRLRAYLSKRKFCLEMNLYYAHVVGF